MDSDYSLFPKIYLAVVITYCRAFPQYKALFPKSALLGCLEGIDIHICSKSRSSNSSFNSHHAKKRRTAQEGQDLCLILTHRTLLLATGVPFNTGKKY